MLVPMRLPLGLLVVIALVGCGGEERHYTDDTPVASGGSAGGSSAPDVGGRGPDDASDGG
jgi:hypothetical protein